MNIFDEAQAYLNMIDMIKDHHETKICHCCEIIGPTDEMIKEPGEPIYYCLDCRDSGALERFLIENNYPPDDIKQVLNLKP